MTKCIKNPGASYITISSLSLTLSPGEVYIIPSEYQDGFRVNAELINYVKNGTLQIGPDPSTFYTNAQEGEVWLRTEFDGDAYIIDGTTVTTYIPAIVTDSYTGKKSTNLFADILIMEKEFYNDPSNPLYEPGFQKFIGSGGREVEHLERTLNLENIHAKSGWHFNQTKNFGVKAPSNVLFYYGWLNSFNSSTNSWTNEKVARDMSKYDIFIFGDGVQNPTHGDYANTSIIIPRLKVLNPNCLIFGYVATAQTLSNFQSKVDQWNTLQVDGIFMDESGYDYGTNRVDFNTRVDYVHGKTYSKVCFVNSWNMDHVLGTANDVSFPNSTWNPTLISSKLNNNDWYLLESFPINTTSYTNGVESVSDWASRGVKAISLRNTYNINLASVGIIDNADINAQKLFDFLYISSLMFSFEAVGSSDTNYGASSATVTFWNRIELSGIENIWSLSPSVQSNLTNTNIYERPVRSARFGLDFSSGYSGYVNRDFTRVSGYSGYSGISGISGYSGFSGYSGISGISGYSGRSGYSGLSGYSGFSGYSGISGSGLSTYSEALTSNFTTTANTATSTNLTFPIAANEIWNVDIEITCQCSNTGGVKFAIAAPTGATIEGWILSSTGVITTPSYQRITAINTLNATAVHTVATTPGPDTIRFVVRNSTNAGNITLQAASGTNGQTTTIFANSCLLACKTTAV